MNLDLESPGSRISHGYFSKPLAGYRESRKVSVSMELLSQLLAFYRQS